MYTILYSVVNCYFYHDLREGIGFELIGFTFRVHRICLRSYLKVKPIDFPEGRAGFGTLWDSRRGSQGNYEYMYNVFFILSCLVLIFHPIIIVAFLNVYSCIYNFIHVFCCLTWSWDLIRRVIWNWMLCRRVICNLCQKSLAYHQSTSSMISHLRRYHPEVGLYLIHRKSRGEIEDLRYENCSGG